MSQVSPGLGGRFAALTIAGVAALCVLTRTLLERHRRRMCR